MLAGSANTCLRIVWRSCQNLTHYEMGLAPQMVDAALPFLNGEGPAKTWKEQVDAK